MTSVSGLGATDRETCRTMISQACGLMLANKDAVHYDRGERRWGAITHRLRAWRGEFPEFSDCSSSVTWILGQAYWHFGLPDLVNDEAWTGGFTGTLLTHGKPVTSPVNWDIGDVFVYGSVWPGLHAAIYIGGGYVFSHGSENGPWKVAPSYRDDLMVVRRFI